MVRKLTCIMCPMGCELTVCTREDAGCVVNGWESGAMDRAAGGGPGGNADGAMIEVSGNTCPRGKEYAIQEMTNPERNIATSVLVKGGELPLASVRLSRPIPKEKIFDVMAEIRRQKLDAPVKAGQVVIENVLGLGSDVIVTKNIERV